MQKRRKQLGRGEGVCFTVHKKGLGKASLTSSQALKDVDEPCSHLREEHSGQRG